MNHFSSVKALENHQLACKNHLPGAVVMPKDVKDLTVEFRNFRGKMIKPFVGYADFEALINKQTKELQEVVVNAVNGEYTATDSKKVEHTFEQHQVHSYAIQIVSQYESLINKYIEISKAKHKFFNGKKMILYMYRGASSDDTMKHFFDDLKDIQYCIPEALKLNIKCKMTNENWKEQKEAITCHICEKEFKSESEKTHHKVIEDMKLLNTIIERDIKDIKDKNELEKIRKEKSAARRDLQELIKERGEWKVMDHDHYNGQYRGAAHFRCNIHYNFKNYRIPIFFHNLRGYDEHFIIHALGKYAKEPARDENDHIIKD